MLAMKQYYPNLNSVKEIICDACHKAKQKKLIFPISSSHSLSPFTLIHVDIWGPCSTTSIHGHKYFITVDRDGDFVVIGEFWCDLMVVNESMVVFIFFEGDL